MARMKRYMLYALTIFSTICFCFANSSLYAEGNISLTLIPPSPVTDQIILDIRAGIWNKSDLSENVSISIYLDKKEPSKMLYEKSISLKPNSKVGVRFDWPTKGQAGRHTIILVVVKNDSTYETERTLQILESDVISTKAIGGAWIDFYHWSEIEGERFNQDLKKMTDKEWGKLVEDMHQLKMNTIVIQEVFRNQMIYDKHTIETDGYKGLSFYPSSLYPNRMHIGAKDPVNAILTAADQKGLNVFLGVGLYAWFDFTAGSLDWHKRIASELWNKYGHHPSFYGWYVSEEIEGGLGNPQQRKNIVSFFEEFKTYIYSLTPDKPIMLATNCHNLRGAEATYDLLLPNLDILCPFGFERMPKGDITGIEAAIKLDSLCKRSGTHLWMDMEIFNFTSNGALIPRPFSEIKDALNQFTDFEKIICYEYTGLLNSPKMSIKPGGKPTIKLFTDYKKYIKKVIK